MQQRLTDPAAPQLIIPIAQADQVVECWLGARVKT